MDVNAAFSPLRGAFPSTAEFQGTLLKYAAKDGHVVVERRRRVSEATCRCCGQHLPGEERYFYLLLVGDRFELVHTSYKSKMHRLQAIGDSFTPNLVPRPESASPVSPVSAATSEAGARRPGGQADAGPDPPAGGKKSP